MQATQVPTTPAASVSPTTVTQLSAVQLTLRARKSSTSEPDKKALVAAWPTKELTNRLESAATARPYAGPVRV